MSKQKLKLKYNVQFELTEDEANYIKKCEAIEQLYNELAFALSNMGAIENPLLSEWFVKSHLDSIVASGKGWSQSALAIVSQKATESVEASHNKEFEKLPWSAKKTKLCTLNRVDNPTSTLPSI